VRDGSARFQPHVIEERESQPADPARTAAERERVADDRPRQADEPERSEAHHDGIERVLRANHPAVEESEGRRHDQHHRSRDEHPGCVCRADGFYGLQEFSPEGGSRADKYADSDTSARRRTRATHKKGSPLIRDPSTGYVLDCKGIDQKPQVKRAALAQSRSVLPYNGSLGGEKWWSVSITLPSRKCFSMRMG